MAADEEKKLKRESLRNRLGRLGLEMLCGRVEGLGSAGREMLARLIAVLLWLFQRRQRALMLRLMRQALGKEWGEEELLRLRRAAYLHMGRTLVEFLRLASLRLDRIRDIVHLEGEEHLQQALARGRGVIVLTAHFGNWELLGARLAQICGERRFHVIAQPQRDKRLTRLMDSIRLRHGVNVIPRGNAAREVLRALQRGEAVGILLDIDMKEKGILVDFLGRPASTTPGVAAFALRTGAALLPVFASRLAEGTHLGRILEPVEVVNTGNWEEDLKENTARFSEIIAVQIRSCPEQWIWLPDRWRTSPPSE